MGASDPDREPVDGRLGPGRNGRTSAGCSPGTTGVAATTRRLTDLEGRRIPAPDGGEVAVRPAARAGAVPIAAVPRSTITPALPRPARRRNFATSKLLPINAYGTGAAPSRRYYSGLQTTDPLFTTSSPGCCPTRTRRPGSGGQLSIHDKGPAGRPRPALRWAQGRVRYLRHPSSGTGVEAARSATLH